MNILVIPTTDWIRHPVPNRLNFIFDTLAEEHEVYVLHFGLKRFSDLPERETKCQLLKASWIETQDPSLYYILNFLIIHIILPPNIIKYLYRYYSIL